MGKRWLSEGHRAHSSQERPKQKALFPGKVTDQQCPPKPAQAGGREVPREAFLCGATVSTSSSGRTSFWAPRPWVRAAEKMGSVQCLQGLNSRDCPWAGHPLPRAEGGSAASADSPTTRSRRSGQPVSLDITTWSLGSKSTAEATAVNPLTDASGCSWLKPDPEQGTVGDCCWGSGPERALRLPSAWREGPSSALCPLPSASLWERPGGRCGQAGPRGQGAETLHGHPPRCSTSLPSHPLGSYISFLKTGS